MPKPTNPHDDLAQELGMGQGAPAATLMAAARATIRGLRADAAAIGKDFLEQKAKMEAQAERIASLETQVQRMTEDRAQEANRHTREAQRLREEAHEAREEAQRLQRLLQGHTGNGLTLELLEALRIRQEVDQPGMMWADTLKVAERLAEEARRWRAWVATAAELHETPQEPAQESPEPLTAVQAPQEAHEVLWAATDVLKALPDLLKAAEELIHPLRTLTSEA